MKRDPRIDSYIANAAPFARPILEHLRALVHAAIPDADEGIKWGMPHFLVGGSNVAGMAAFKAHCAFTIHGEGRQVTDGMGSVGKIASLADLPPDADLTATLLAAVKRIAAHGTALPKRAPARPKVAAATPEELSAALADNEAARRTFEAFAPSHRREYINWIAEAKRDETRAKRVAQAIEWLAEGKKRNWKYEAS